MQFSFRNRVGELEALAKFASDAGTSPDLRIAVVHGGEGVGKTSLINKSIDEYFDDQVLKVIVTFNPYRSYESGAFLRKIAHEIHQALSQIGAYYILESFLLSMKAEPVMARIASAGGLDLIKSIPGLGAAAKELTESIKDTAKLKDFFIAPATTKDLDLFLNYIIYVAKSRHICIHIKNFQVIDEFSLSSIEDYSGCLSNISMIAECTESPSDLFQDGQKFKRLRYVFDKLEIIEVKPLPLELLYDQIISRPSALFSLIAKSYQAEAGNLKDIERLLSVPSEASKELSISSINTGLLKSLPRGQLITLMLLCLNDGVLRSGMLSLLLRKAAPEYRLEYSELRAGALSQFVSLDDEICALDHDSTIGRLLMNDDFQFERQYAAHLLRVSLFEATSDIRKFSLQDLLQYIRLSILCNDADAVSSALDIVDSLFTADSGLEDVIETTITFLEKLTKINEQHSDIIAKKLVRILFRHNLLSKVTLITERIADRGRDELYYHVVALLSSVNLVGANNWLAIAENRFLGESPNPPQGERLLFTLLRVWYLRLIGDIEAAISLYRSIAIDAIEDMEQKATALRYAEIADIDDAAPRLLRARDIAESLPLRDLANDIELALSLEKAESGRITEAREALAAVALRVERKSFFFRYSVLNNALACDVLDGVSASSTELEGLRRWISDPFDRLIVENNIMLGNILRSEHDSAHQKALVIEALIDISSNMEKNIVKISYLNLSYAYGILGNAGKADYYWSRMSETKTAVDLNYWRTISDCRDREVYAKASPRPFFPPLMTNWFIDPDIFLRPRL